MERLQKSGNPSARKRAPTQRLKETPLTEDDWTDAATEILVNENVRGIRIDALCKRLGVTKGSFYWHFQGRDELLAALLDKWRLRMTTNVIDRLASLGASPKQRLRALFALPHRGKSPSFSRVEQSIRDWGRRDPQANAAVCQVDKLRLDFFRALLIEQGLTPDAAEKRAYTAYTIMMGDSVLRGTLPDEAESEARLDTVIALLTAED